MKKNILVPMGEYNIELITNGKDEFDNVVICFHGFNGDKWGDAYSGLKRILEKSLVCSFDSCGHGTSEVLAIDMRLDQILKEIDVVVNYVKNIAKNKPIVLVAVSYGGYRILNYLVKYKPSIQKVIYVNPAFRMLEILQLTKNFNYKELKENDLVSMKRSLNKFMAKPFLDDLFKNNLYLINDKVSYNTDVFIGTKDDLIPREDTLEIVNKNNYNLFYVEDYHCFEKEENWKLVAERIKEAEWKIL